MGPRGPVGCQGDLGGSPWSPHEGAPWVCEDSWGLRGILGDPPDPLTQEDQEDPWGSFLVYHLKRSEGSQRSPLIFWVGESGGIHEIPLVPLRV